MPHQLTKKKNGKQDRSTAASSLGTQHAPGSMAEPAWEHASRLPPAIEMVDLCKTFHTFQAVDHLSLTVQRGEIFGLLGPNGSGKTTTMNMLCGLSAPTSGTIRVFDYTIPRQSRQMHRILGAVPQETALYEDLSAWQNMDLHAALFGIAGKAKRERIIQMLELGQLLERKNEPVRTFSGGMKRRLALVRAFLSQPQLLILDEPTLGVDVQARNAIWSYIFSQRDQGCTIVLTTNYLEEAQTLCDRIAILDHGRLVAIDTPDALRRKYGDSVIDVVTKLPTQSADKIGSLQGVLSVEQNGTHLVITSQGGDEDLAPQILTLLAADGLLQQVKLREPHLDDIYLQLTGTNLRD